MKKIIIAIAVLLNCSFLMAQTEFDALKLSQTDITGTARYMGMAGAFGALGGDASAIKDNPAGLGIYRSSELTGTLDFRLQTGNSTWNGVKNMDDQYNLGFNNFSYVIASPTWRKGNGASGLLSSNFSFSYNRLANFNRSLNIQSGPAASSMTDYMAYFTGNIPSGDLAYTSSYEPFDNVNVPWLSVMAFEGKLMNESVDKNNVSSWSSLLGNNETVTPSYTLTEKGYVDEYSLGWAGNFNNKFFLGTTINFRSLNYSSVSNYSESFSGNGGMSLRDSIYSSGTGFNLSVGTIYCPTNNIRLGLSVHTPTIYAMSDNYYAKLIYNTTVTGYTGTPGGSSDYQLQGPLKLDLSAAYIIGTKGLVSVEYDYENNTGIRLMDKDGDSQSFSDENQGMSQMLSNVSTIKIGGEYKLNNNFSLRAGYAYSSNATDPNAAKLIQYNTIRTDTEFYRNNSTNYFTAGFGYREAGWFIDCAYMNKTLDESFFPYNSNNLAITVNPAKVITSTNNIVVTLGLKL